MWFDDTEALRNEWHYPLRTNKLKYVLLPHGKTITVYDELERDENEVEITGNDPYGGNICMEIDLNPVASVYEHP